jgi:Protein of unknown function (DUF3572)
MTDEVSNRAHAVALRALAWTLEDSDRAHRLLALTGLDADQVRGRIDDPTLLDAVIAFLEAHEPDLMACATAIDVTPHELVAIRPHLLPSPSGEGRLGTSRAGVGNPDFDGDTGG